MATPVQENDMLNFAEGGKPKIPSTLNVLTILTYIGCAITLLSTIAMPYLMKFSAKMMDKMKSGEIDMPASQLKQMENAQKMMEVTQQNLVPIMTCSFIGIALCFWGAMWMRKLKKDGLWIYIAGQVIPIAAGMLILGKYQFVDWKNYLNYIVPVVFIILYLAQKKYLVK